jgi:hypothetical protein
MRITLLLLMFSCISVLKAQNLGMGLSLVPESGLFGFQVRGAYNATEKLSLSGAYSYYIKKGTNFSLDFDAQFKIINISDLSISPFAGINIGKKYTSGVNTALQLGLFIQIPRDGVDFYIEPKAILDANSVIALAGGFYF